MHWGNYQFVGMHMFWWLFWIVAAGALFWLLSSRGKRESTIRATPLDILKERYARGEIDSAEYEERKAQLMRDASPE